MSTFYAKNGDEITLEQWGRLLSDMEYKRVAITTLPSGRWVSTVWLGLDHSFSLSPVVPLIFETMVFDNSGSMEDEYVERYATEAQAKEGHERIVNMVRELEEIDGRTRHTHQAPGGSGSDGEEDQERDHDLRATPDAGDVHDPQHPV